MTQEELLKFKKEEAKTSNGAFTLAITLAAITHLVLHGYAWMIDHSFLKSAMIIASIVSFGLAGYLWSAYRRKITTSSKGERHYTGNEYANAA